MAAPRPSALNGAVPDNLPVLSRPRDGAMLGGVCAGLARKWGVDPNLVRISVVVLAFFGGLGLAAYGAGLLLIPRDGTRELPVRRILPFTRTWSTPAVVAATIGALVLLLGLTTGSSGIGLGPVAVIFAVWFFGFRNRNPQPPVAQQPEPTPFERASDAWRVRLAEQQTPGYEHVPLAAPEEQRWTQPYTDPAADLAVRDNEPPAVIAARRHRRRIWWLAMILVGVGVLVVSVLGLAGLPTGPLAYAAAVLAGLGLALVASAQSGRPPLLLPATLIAAIATGALLLPSGFRVPEVGELHRAYGSVAEVPAAINYAAGDVDLDLSGLRLTGDRELAIHVGAGSVNLTLPKDANTEVTWKVKAGSVDTGDGNSRDGFDLAGTSSYPAAEAGAPTLRIAVNVDLGELAVQR